MKTFFLSIFAALLLPYFLTIPVQAEAFGNYSVQIPSVSLAYFDTPFFPASRTWGVDSQWQIGTSFMSAIDYRWWWMVETSLGLGKLNVADNSTLAALQAGGGVKYYLSDNDVRPFLGLGLSYLHFLGASASKMPLNNSWPIWLGLKPTFGLEWLFHSEMSFLLEGAYGLYFNINESLRQNVGIKLAYAIYF